MNIYLNIFLSENIKSFHNISKNKKTLFLIYYDNQYGILCLNNKEFDLIFLLALYI